MRKTLCLLLVATTILSSCGESKIEQGEVEYLITYPYTEVSGFMEAILPEKATLVFKGTKMKSNVSRGKIFTTDLISDEATNLLEMRLDFGDKFFYAELDANDVKAFKASQPVYTINPTSNQDSVQGLWSTEYTVTSEDTITHQNAWFTEALAPQNGYWYSSYHQIKGVPLIFDVERYGVIMHFEAVKFTQREVLDSEFERDPGLKKVSFEEYESEVQELFDILMN